jgi:CBS domain-containing protein
MMPSDISESAAAVPSSVRTFADTFRKVLLRRTTSLLSDQAEVLIAGVGNELEARASIIDAGMMRLGSLLREVPEAAPERLGELIEEYYATAYDLFLQSRSTIAFFRLSGELLRAVTAAIVGHAAVGLGVPAGKMPPLAVIALGPGGRQEFSPFCRLQLLLVHGEAEPSLAEGLGHRLHESFAATGLRPDTLITPRNPDWRGTPAQWSARVANGLNRGNTENLIQLLRLSDLSMLHDADGRGGDFRRDCFRQLSSCCPAMRNLMDRSVGIGRGAALLGRIRLNRRGPHAGMFNLLNNALLPLSASLSALSLLWGIEAVDTPRRIGELCDRGGLDPEMAKQLGSVWQQINELRLLSEALEHPRWNSQNVLWLPLLSSPPAEMQYLKEGLKVVSLLQRHLEKSFKRWEEQVSC